MSVSKRACKHTEVDHLRKFLAYAKWLVNKTWYYPPSGGYEYSVALALYSKCLTVAEATLVLIEAGFGDEAFGMTRTLVDIFFTLRYVANKDTHERAKRYAQFAAKSSAVWAEVVKIYWPHRVQPLPEQTKKVAATFRSPHSWSGKSAKEIALEADTVEVDPSGKPFVHEVSYRIIYRWTSQYVHPTVDALHNHLVQAGHDNFVVRSNKGKDMTHMAAFNVALYIGHTIIAFYRCMGDPQPNRLSRWAGALIHHLARRHD
ncbi:MAG TPA: DUF5677 domain-containing protein [Candidatus Binatia bacterium]|nr:DUF5677 domain-containing protein [Candidatus Binatia bacterium]